jgi:hypothetical protein
MRLAHQSHNRKVETRMSRSVQRTEVLPVSVCPTVQSKQRFHPLKETIWPLGENALPEEILRWLSHCFLANTVVFLPLTLRQRTHRNAIWLSRCSVPILAQSTKSGIPRMSLYIFIHPRLERAGLSKNDFCNVVVMCSNVQVRRKRWFAV